MCFYLYLIGIIFILHHDRVNSFVLLTAKIEDIKKLAKNFISDETFKQLAEFVYRLNENKAVEIFDDVDTVEKQENGNSRLNKDLKNKEGSGSDVSLSSENMKYKASFIKTNLKTRFESKSRNVKPKDDTHDTQTDNKEDKLLIDNIYLNNDMITTDNLESDASDTNIAKRKKTKRKRRTKNDKTLRISTVTSAKERNEFDQYDNFNYKKQWESSKALDLKNTDSVKSIYI